MEYLYGETFLNILATVGIAGLALTVLVYALIYVPMQQEKTFYAKLKRQREIQAVLDEIRDRTNVQRALLLVSNNGHDIHRLDTRLKVSVIAQSYEPPFRSVIQEYQNIVVDGEYAAMLQDVYDNGIAAFFVEKMPHGLLKTLYEGEGVYWSAIYRIAEDKTKKKFYYMSLATSQDKSPYQKGYEKEILICLNKIRTIHEYLNRPWSKRVREKLYL